MLNITQLPQWFIMTWLFMLGAVVGSFLNVCIHRFPKHEKLWDQLKAILGPSHCPQCKANISVLDKLPILGWFIVGGKCRTCQYRISPRYPFIELLNGLLWVLVYWFELPNGFATTWQEGSLMTWHPGSAAGSYLGPHLVDHAGAWSVTSWMHMRYFFHMVLIQALVVATFIDFDLQIIPDGSTVPAMIFAVIASTAIGQLFLVPVWFDEPSHRSLLPESLHFLFVGVPDQFIELHPHLHGFLVSIVGLLVGGGSIWAVRIIGFYVLKQEAMGFGDVILMACIGAFLGWQPVIVVFFLAAMCAMVSVIFSSIFSRQREIPYGPYISLGALLLLLFWKEIWIDGGVRTYFGLGVGIVIAGLAMGVMLFLSLSLLQLVKRMLGISMYYEEEVGEWTSADTLTYLSFEKVDQDQGQWRREGWEGSKTSRGQRQEQIWRDGR